MIFQRHFESVTIPSTKFGRGVTCLRADVYYPISSVARGKRIACVTSVSVRFRSKKRGTRQKPRIPFLGLSLLRNQWKRSLRRLEKGPERGRRPFSACIKGNRRRLSHLHRRFQPRSQVLSPTPLSLSRSIGDG